MDRDRHDTWARDGMRWMRRPRSGSLISSRTRALQPYGEVGVVVRLVPTLISSLAEQFS